MKNMNNPKNQAKKEQGIRRSVWMFVIGGLLAPLAIYLIGILGSHEVDLLRKQERQDQQQKAVFLVTNDSGTQTSADRSVVVHDKGATFTMVPASRSQTNNFISEGVFRAKMKKSSQ